MSESAIDKSESLGIHLSVLKKLTEVISESIEAEVHPDYKKGEDGVRRPENGYNKDKLIHRFYGAVETDGAVYRVKTTIIETLENKVSTVPHSFEVTEIELLSEDNSSMRLEPTVSPTESGVPHRAAKLLKGVEKSYDEGKFLLEESEKSEDLANDSDKGNNPRFREGGRRGGNGGGLTVEERKAAAERVAERVAGPLGVRVRVVAASEIEGEDCPFQLLFGLSKMACMHFNMLLRRQFSFTLAIR